jgi:hypothetical protein
MSAQREVDVVCKTKENICARLSLRAILRARSALFAQLSLAQIFPLPKTNKQKRKNFNNKSSPPAPPRKTTAKKKRNLKKFKAKQTEKKSCSAWKFLLVNTIVIFAQFAKQV